MNESRDSEIAPTDGRLRAKSAKQDAPRIRVSDLHGIGIGILIVVLFNRNGRAFILTSYDYHAPFLTLDLLLRNPFPLRIGLRPPHHG